MSWLNNNLNWFNEKLLCITRPEVHFQSLFEFIVNIIAHRKSQIIGLVINYTIPYSCLKKHSVLTYSTITQSRIYILYRTNFTLPHSRVSTKRHVLATSCTFESKLDTLAINRIVKSQLIIATQIVQAKVATIFWNNS